MKRISHQRSVGRRLSYGGKPLGMQQGVNGRRADPRSGCRNVEHLELERRYRGRRGFLNLGYHRLGHIESSVHVQQGKVCKDEWLV